MHEHLFQALIALSTGRQVDRRAGRELAASGDASEALDGTFALTTDGMATLAAERSARRASAGTVTRRLEGVYGERGSAHTAGPLWSGMGIALHPEEIAGATYVETRRGLDVYRLPCGGWYREVAS